MSAQCKSCEHRVFGGNAGPAEPSWFAVRRKLLGLAVASAGTCFAPAVHTRGLTEGLQGMEAGDPQTTQGFWERPRWLWVRRMSTGEQVRLVYWRDGQLIEDAHRQISWLMRDVRFEHMLRAGDPAIRRALDRGLIGQQHLSPWMLMDPALLDIHYAYSAWLYAFGIQEPLGQTSGLRHMITNAMTEGAAFDSKHQDGRASDIVVPGVSVQALGRFGQFLRGGGVGVYERKAFVHIDTGRVRSWSG